MNLRYRLNLIVTAVLLIILVIGAVKAIHNAREDVRAEVASTMDFALHMLDAELSHFRFRDKVLSEESQSPFMLSKLAGVRHLRIEFYGPTNQLIESNEDENSNEHQPYPDWFGQEMYSALDDLKPERLPVYVNTKKIGELVIKPKPDNEIAEAWGETKTLLTMISLFFVFVNILVYMVVARALKPIDQIIAALTDIETGNLDSRLPIFELPEMASISHKFNMMASTLQSSIRNNHRLTQQIIRLQEAERKSLAHELHDEIGQHLTAIHVDASVIKSTNELEAAKKSASAIDEVVGLMMDILRTMLQRLRPGGLDELGFIAAMQELVDSWRERHPNIEMEYHFDGEFSCLEENAQLTLYRVIQECLTNISRHSKANQAWIVLKEEKQMIHLTVSDNGKGFDPKQHTQRFGLAGMKERLDSVGGTFEISSNLNQGVTIDVTVPKQGDNA